MYDQLSNQEKLWEIQIIKLVDISTFKRARGWRKTKILKIQQLSL
jgi:hypothetical protein